MSVLRYTDIAVSCNQCDDVLWGSAMGLPDGMTESQVRRCAQLHGWTSTRFYPRGQDKLRTEDYCPQHAVPLSERMIA